MLLSCYVIHGFLYPQIHKVIYSMIPYTPTHPSHSLTHPLAHPLSPIQPSTHMLTHPPTGSLILVLLLLSVGVCCKRSIDDWRVWSSGHCILIIGSCSVTGLMCCPNVLPELWWLAENPLVSLVVTWFMLSFTNTLHSSFHCKTMLIKDVRLARLSWTGLWLGC